jgi:trigger factor
MRSAILEQNIEAFARPEVELEKLEPVTFKAVVPLKPEVKLGDYTGIRVEKEKAEVTDETVDKIVENLRHQWATWEPVADGALEYGNIAVFDIDSSFEDKPYIVQKGAQYQVNEGQLFPVAGFAEQIVGMKAGEEKEFDLRVGEETADAEVAGKEIHFKVSLSEIKREVLPELTDEFASQVDPELKTMEELRNKAREDMLKRAEENAAVDFEEKLVNAVVDLSEIEFPPVL